MSAPAAPVRTLVVAGLIGGAGGRILLTRRCPDQPLPDQWELPGGKIEPGESPTQALARELLEEIGARVEIGPIWDVLHHRYPEHDVLMLVYACRLCPGEEPRCIEVGAVAWARPDELAGYDVLPADRPLVERLEREGPPPFCAGGTEADGSERI
ncbi:MAG TPA: (deoxy)nucleoside triphosphate pyrophosphohydrolase [Kofleriaceae bacterium]|nr:(deoxy)nucleoside triphosphate pyrophosphohydrolase [Kofleriaceae bacterium]